MKHSVADIVLNQFSRSLIALKEILREAEAHARARDFNPDLFLQLKLSPDMFPLVKQVQITCDIAKASAARLSGSEIPSHPDTESSLEELLSRIDKTLNYLSRFKENDFSNYTKQTVSFKWNPGLQLNGDDYLVSYAIPNFYFHLTTTYALLRMHGVNLGKADYLGKLNWQEI